LDAAAHRRSAGWRSSRGISRFIFATSEGPRSCTPSTTKSPARGADRRCAAAFGLDSAPGNGRAYSQGAVISTVRNAARCLYITSLGRIRSRLRTRPCQIARSSELGRRRASPVRGVAILPRDPAIYPCHIRRTSKLSTELKQIAGPGGRVMPKACFQHDRCAAAFGLQSAPCTFERTLMTPSFRQCATRRADCVSHNWTEWALRSAPSAFRSEEHSNPDADAPSSARGMASLRMILSFYPSQVRKTSTRGANVDISPAPGGGLAMARWPSALSRAS